MEVKSKKRSRFAKDSESTEHQSLTASTENIGYSDDDYMAPLPAFSLPETKSLLNASSSASNSKNKKQMKSIQTIMEDNRDQKLAEPLSSNNIGFKLLKKIGYKEGESLGKDNKGLIEPLPLHARTNLDISGVGINEMKQRKVEKIQDSKKEQAKFAEKLTEDFVHNQSSVQMSAKQQRDAKKAQKIIYELDESAGVAVHKLTASLHCRYIRASTNNYEDNDYASEKEHDSKELEDPTLEECLQYLREMYCYCYFCGAKYIDTEDLLNNCPGSAEEQH